jgi:hypothetical protein
MVAKRQNHEQNCILKIIFVAFLKCRNGYIKYVHNSIYKGQNFPENEGFFSCNSASQLEHISTLVPHWWQRITAVLQPQIKHKASDEGIAWHSKSALKIVALLPSHACTLNRLHPLCPCWLSTWFYLFSQFFTDSNTIIQCLWKTVTSLYNNHSNYLETPTN